MTALAIATVVLFVVVLVLAVVVLSLARQVGVLHERLAPAGLTRAQGGVTPGNRIPAQEADALSGARVEFEKGPFWLLFVGTDCPVCRSVLPAFSAAVDRFGLPAYWVADGLPGAAGERPDYEGYAARHQLDPDRFLISQSLGLTLGVRELPALAVVDENGILLALDVVDSPRAVAASVERSLGHTATPSGENST